MRIRETPNGLQISLRAPLSTLLTLLIRTGDQQVWEIVHSSFKPVKEPIYSIHPRTGQPVPGIVMEIESVTVTPASELAPDREDEPDSSYATHIIVGEVPTGYRQRFPASAASPLLVPSERYYVRAWATEFTEAAIFTKRQPLSNSA